MKKILGIMLFMLLLQNSCVFAQDSSSLLKNNLKLKVVPLSNSQVENPPASEIYTEYSIKKNINKSVSPIKPEPVVDKSEVKIPEIKAINLKIPKANDMAPLQVQPQEAVNGTQSVKEVTKLNFEIIPQEKNTKEDLSSQTYDTGLLFNEKVKNLSPVVSGNTNSNIVYKSAFRKINVINPQKNVNADNNYPGFRGPNQLIVYTPLYGLRTGTNEFGTEAIVENNMVVRLNGADSIIPRNGFVISGHGSAKQWIVDNIQVGTKVYIDYTDNSIKAILTPDGLLFSAKEKLKEITSIADYYKEYTNSYNDKKVKEYIAKSKNLINKAEQYPDKAQSYVNEASDTLDIAMKNAIPYIDSEIKGVWLRPVEKTEDAIEKTIEKLADSGITDIFLETYFHGKTIYPSEHLKRYGVINQREEFLGFDPLAVWIKKAHRKNMKVHIWFETFYVGNDNPQKTARHVLNLYPSWSNKRLCNYSSQVPVASFSEHNGYFLDPANPQVQAYLLGIINEIIEEYKPDGINLDYIRYPQTVEPSVSNYAQMNWGYTEYARQEFMYLYGIDPVGIKYGTRDWDYWSSYRQTQITKFVKSVKAITSKHKMVLTTVIFPDLYKSMATKMQNWRLWSVNDYVDGLTPLILSGDKNTAEMLLRDVVRNKKTETAIYPGIFIPFMGGSLDDLLVQIHKTREYNAKGVIFFDYAHLNNNYIDGLTTRVFNKSYEPKENKQKVQQSVPNVEVKQSKKKKKRRRKNNGND